MSSGSNIINTIEEYTETVVGKHGSSSYAQLITEYRKTLLNIDVKVLGELDSLFLGLWE